MYPGKHRPGEHTDDPKAREAGRPTVGRRTAAGEWNVSKSERNHVFSIWANELSERRKAGIGTGKKE